MKVWRWLNKIQVFPLGYITRNLVPRFLPASMVPKVIVVSPGGVGTTFLMDHLARYTSINSSADSDFLKHLPGVPERWLAKGKSRVIYVHGDFSRAYSSLKRRGWEKINYFKISGRPAGDLTEDEFILSATSQLNSFCGAANRHPESVFIVDFDKVWNEKEAIRRFLNLPEDFASSFPARKQRHT